MCLCTSLEHATAVKARRSQVQVNRMQYTSLEPSSPTVLKEVGFRDHAAVTLKPYAR